MFRSLAATGLALALFTVTFAVNLQAPLYSAYAAESGMGAAAVTIAFSAYVAGLMPTLLLLGGLSDRIGRRTPIAISLMLGVLATGLLVVSPSWMSLIIARLLLGVGTGLATTAGTAYMAELMGADHTRRAALVVTSATSLGFGGGALATGISLSLHGESFFPASYWALFLVTPLLALAIMLFPPVDNTKQVSLFRWPVFPENTAAFGMAMALAWSTTGMTIAIIPLQLSAHGYGNWTGLVIFLAIFAGFLCQPAARRLSNSRALATGLLLTPLGFLFLLSGAWLNSIGLVLLGTALSSASSYGFTYLSALSEFSTRAPENRARATAGMFVYAYVGFSIPVIGSGVLADMFGLLTAMSAFGLLLVAASIAVSAYLFHAPSAQHETREQN